MPLFSTKDIFFGFVKGFFAIWQLWLFLGFLALIKFAYMIWDKNRLAKSGINEIDHMDGLTFEKYLQVLFVKLGYRVERTQYIGDYGADLVAS
jgi:restriction system protein